jgi:hypothetical protein
LSAVALEAIVSLFSALQYALFLGVVLALVKPVGRYLERVFDGERTFLDPVMRPVERFIYRCAGVNPRQEMDWKQYAGALLLFSLCHPGDGHGPYRERTELLSGAGLGFYRRVFAMVIRAISSGRAQRSDG